MRWVSDRLLEHCLGLPFGYKCGAIVWWSEFNTDKMIASSWNFFHPYLRLCCSSAKMVICQQLIGCIGYKCIFEVCLLFQLFPRNRRSLSFIWAHYAWSWLFLLLSNYWNILGLKAHSFGLSPHSHQTYFCVCMFGMTLYCRMRSNIKSLWLGI